MRSGQLDRVFTIQAFSSTVDEYGTPAETWAEFATVRAQKVQASTDEFIAGYGESDRTVVIFRTRWMDAITTDHRVQFEGQDLNIREITEIGRREGLELRCEEVRT